MKVTVICTCFNRKESTLRCIRRLTEGNPDETLSFLIVDGGSTDGTREALSKTPLPVTLIKGTGPLYWAGGMRAGIAEYLQNGTGDYVLLVNDDVRFYDGIISRMIALSEQKENAVIVGATCGAGGELTYGGMQLILPRKKDIYRQVEPQKGGVPCDTFNCNCVLLPDRVLRSAGNFDPAYTHSLADLDYGLRLKRNGVLMVSSEEYVGVCEKNSREGTWQDPALSRRERLRKKESPKGAPLCEWFHFMKKNFGWSAAIRYSVSPYVRILTGK